MSRAFTERRRRQKALLAKHREWVANRYGYNRNCDYCGKLTVYVHANRFTPDSPTLDHFVPLSLGGEDARSNYRLACYACNQEKGNMHPSAWAHVMIALGIHQV